MHFAAVVTVCFLCFHVVLSQDACGTDADFLAMDVDTLYDTALYPKNVGGCYISRNTGSGVCDLYVVASTTGSGTYRGWPRTVDGRGTGCVKAPELPKGITNCFFDDPGYNLPASVVATMCTENGKQNAIAQLRHAISNGQCNIVPCTPSPTPSPSSSPTPSPSCLSREGINAMSTDDLWDQALEPKNIGGCFIRLIEGPGAACDIYVIASTKGNAGYVGWPRTVSRLGTGCVRAPDFPKAVGTCYFDSYKYDLRNEERASFCTDNGKDNAVAQLRHAIHNGQCKVKFCSSPAPSPTPPPTPSPFACAPASKYLSMSTDELWERAVEPKSIGGCRIRLLPGAGPVCDIYVLANTEGSGGYIGWPRSRDGRGTGCVRAIDFPKGMATCFFNDPVYDLTAAERASFCTDNGKDNAVNQLKHAISNGQCNIVDCGTWDPKLLKSEARISGWKCMNRKPGKGGLFASTADYILQVDDRCSSCRELPSQAWMSKNVKPPSKRCRGCKNAVRKNRPSRKMFSVDDRNQYVGKSCRIVKGDGCWPTFFDEEIFSCGVGEECRVAFYTRNVAVTCCADVKKCFRGNPSCLKANENRCKTWRAKKYSGKIKGNVQVLFE